MKVTAKGSQMATKCANLTEHTWDLGEECLTAGGCVSSMEWDPLGGRLAVIFQGNSCAPKVIRGREGGREGGKKERTIKYTNF